MKQRSLLHSLVVVTFLLTVSMGQCAAEQEQSDESDPIAVIQNRYKELLMSKDRYKIPSSLSNKSAKFRRLSDREKEKRLVKWFTKKEHKNLADLTFQEIIYKIGFMLLAVPVFLLLFGASYIAITKIFWKCVIALLKIISSDGSMDDLDALADQLSRALPSLKMVSMVFGGAPLPGPLGALGGDNAKQLVKLNSLVTLLALYYTLSYFNMPISWAWKYLYDTWLLYKFMGNPYLDSKVVKADRTYIKSSYLFDDQQKHIIESLLLSAHAGNFTRIGEIETYILTFRALPKGVKPVVYDQKAIDIAFEGYSPELKELAENMIAILVIYTEAIEADKGDLLQGLPIKPILLAGLPGTGKSRFIKKISEVTGLNITYVSLASEFRVEFKGQNGDKQLLGLPCAYVRAFRASTDKWGRNYENNLIVFEEISSNFDDKMAVDYLKIFLDPRVKKVKDAYMRIPIKKLPFIFATSNELPQNPALYDRFMIFELNSIEKDNKKLIMGKLVRIWSSFLADPDLQDEYDESFNGQELITYLTEKAHNFIDQKDGEGSIRPSEEETLKEIMSLIKTRIQKRSERKKHMKKQAEIVT